MESPSQEVFKTCGDVAPGDMVSGHGGGGLKVGCDDLRGLFPTWKRRAGADLAASGAQGKSTSCVEHHP